MPPKIESSPIAAKGETKMPKPLQNQQLAQHRSHVLGKAQGRAALDRHSRKCAVCHHPEREAIEEAFVHWRSPDYIATDFNLDDRRILYRHAHATGLYEQRRRNYLFTIENILECGEEIEFTAAAYIKAVRAYACLCDTVRWSEPVTRVTHEYNTRAESSGPPPAPEEASTHQPEEDPASVSSTSLPEAAIDTPAAAPQAPPADSSATPVKESESADPASPIMSDEKFIAIVNSMLRTSHRKPPAPEISNRHTPELETRVSHRKQRSEVVSNRHKIAK
jgi:hypothetical protein